MGTVCWLHVNDANHRYLLRAIRSINTYDIALKLRYKEVIAFLVDAEELLDIYDVDVPELGLPPARDFSS